jgi:hypothetical protein
VSFYDILFSIENRQILDIVEHRNPRYKGQKIFVIRIDNYAYLVPFEETKDKIMLKTIIPSRKATKIYIKKGRKNEKDEA